MAKGPCIFFKKGVETKDKGVFEQEWKEEESTHLKCMEGRIGCTCARQPGQIETIFDCCYCFAFE